MSWRRRWASLRRSQLRAIYDMMRAMNSTVAYVIDDDTALRTAYASSLHKLGMQVETGADGLEAKEMIQKSSPDVILLDMLMPNLDGMGFLHYLREHKKYDEVKVVVASNFPIMPDLSGLQVAKFLPKQKYTPDQIAEEVAAIVEASA